MVSGALACTFYGEPRTTLDIDIVVMMDASDIVQLSHIFPISQYYLPPSEVIEVELRRSARGHFNIIHPTSGLKADFYPSREHPLFTWAMSHRRAVRVRDIEVQLAPPEYVILWKLEFYREGGEQKHVRDIRGMLAVSGDEIDRAIVEDGVAQRNLQKQWQACLA